MKIDKKLAKIEKRERRDKRENLLTKKRINLLILNNKLKKYKEELDQLKKENKRYKKLALLDPLTKTGNRELLKIEIIKIFDLAFRENENFGMILIDLDNLKIVNDKHGHSTGDKLIKHTANVLKKSIRESDILCRIGGDEFIILLIKSDLVETEIVIDNLKQILEKNKVAASMGYCNLQEIIIQNSLKMNKIKNKKQFKNLMEKVYLKIFKKADKRLYLEKSNKKIHRN